MYDGHAWMSSLHIFVLENISVVIAKFYLFTVCMCKQFLVMVCLRLPFKSTIKQILELSNNVFLNTIMIKNDCDNFWAIYRYKGPCDYLIIEFV